MHRSGKEIAKGTLIGSCNQFDDAVAGVQSGSIDTTAANYININGDVAAGDTLTIAGYSVVFYPAGGN